MGETIFEVRTIWVVFSLSALFFLIAAEIGFQIGCRRRGNAEKLESGSTGIVTGAILGLVSFLLAFTFSIAAGNFSERRGVVLDEANAIGTAYLRADLLPEPQAENLRALLVDYTEIRVAVTRPGVTVEGYFDVIRQSEALHGDMWAIVTANARDDPTPIAALAVASMNDVIDLHTVRVAVGVRHTIPNIIWIALYLISGVALATTGYRFGASFGVRSELLPAMVVAFASIATLISDLDNPRHGFLLNDQSPMQELLRSMEQ